MTVTNNTGSEVAVNVDLITVEIDGVEMRVPKGTLVIDAGAVAALARGKSLLPAGVIRVDGAFGRGDAVIIRGPDGAEIGRGLVAYDAGDAAKITRKSSDDIARILGIDGRPEMVHRDDMVLGGA